MKFKIIFGVIIPLLLMLVLAILGSSDEGFSLKKKFVESISTKEVIYNDQLRNTIKIGDITLKNDYFLGKRSSLKPLIACLIDKEKVKQNLNAGSVFYSEGDYESGSDSLINYNSNSQERSVEIPAHGSKKVYVYITPSYAYYANYSELLEQYKDYDELVVLEQKKSNDYYNSYADCYGLQESDFENGEHILLILN